MTPKCIAVIPARLASTRIPHKPLADVGGEPLIRRVWENAVKLKNVDEVIIATDSKKIMEVMSDAVCFMTPSELSSGSDRVHYVSNKFFDDADIIVNIQGDEPFIDTKMVDELINDAKSGDAGLYSAYFEISKVEAEDTSVVKVVLDGNANAIYFSRRKIPYGADSYNKHLGIYVWKKWLLDKFSNWIPSKLESAEKLEQLRVLEHGYKIKMRECFSDSVSVDTYDDLKKVREYFQ